MWIRGPHFLSFLGFLSGGFPEATGSATNTATANGRLTSHIWSSTTPSDQHYGYHRHGLSTAYDQPTPPGKEPQVSVDIQEAYVAGYKAAATVASDLASGLVDEAYQSGFEDGSASVTVPSVTQKCHGLQAPQLASVFTKPYGGTITTKAVFEYVRTSVMSQGGSFQHNTYQRLLQEDPITAKRIQQLVDAKDVESLYYGTGHSVQAALCEGATIPGSERWASQPCCAACLALLQDKVI